MEGTYAGCPLVRLHFPPTKCSEQILVLDWGCQGCPSLASLLTAPTHNSLCLLWITGWDAEDTDPLDLALLFDAAVVAANHAAPVRAAWRIGDGD